MEISRVTNFRHRRSPSSDRFLGLFSASKPSNLAADSIFSGDELHEAEFFWTGSDSVESTRSSTSPLPRRNQGFSLKEKSGILAALSDDVVLPSATPFRAIPKPPPQQRVTGELTQSAPPRRFQNSAPIKVPPAMRKPGKTEGFGIDDEEDDEDEMLPPHEIVAMKLKTTSSVLEGVGRTLKGRDLRQVRNAVWSRTGFLD